MKTGLWSNSLFNTVFYFFVLLSDDLVLVERDEEDHDEHDHQIYDHGEVAILQQTIQVGLLHHHDKRLHQCISTPAEDEIRDAKEAVLFHQVELVQVDALGEPVDAKVDEKDSDEADVHRVRNDQVRHLFGKDVDSQTDH